MQLPRIFTQYCGCAAIPACPCCCCIRFPMSSLLISSRGTLAMAAFHLVTSTATETEFVGHGFGILATIQWPNTADGSRRQADYRCGTVQRRKQFLRGWQLLRDRPTFDNIFRESFSRPWSRSKDCSPGPCRRRMEWRTEGYLTTSSRSLMPVQGTACISWMCISAAEGV